MINEQKPSGWYGRPIGGETERRADQRHLTVYRVAKVQSANDTGLWRVKNMSDRGMLFESGAAVAPNGVIAESGRKRTLSWCATDK